MSRLCGDCGAKEGHFHQPGCDMETCPFCGSQLLSCDCVYDYLGLKDRKKYAKETGYLPADIFEEGLSEEQIERWLGALRAKGRIPFISYPIICAKCGKLWPNLFMVPNEEWKHYIAPRKRRSVICRDCYDFIKYAIDTATRS